MMRGRGFAILAGTLLASCPSRGTTRGLPDFARTSTATNPAFTRAVEYAKRLGSPPAHGYPTADVVSVDDLESKCRTKHEPACAKLVFIRTNCAILDRASVVCDLRLAWRLFRYAHYANLSTIKNPDTGEHYLKREALYAFLESDLKNPSSSAMVADMASIDRFYGGFPDLQERHALIFNAMFGFFLLHEFGHAAEGHLDGTALPLCVVAPSACQAPRKMTPSRH